MAAVVVNNVRKVFRKEAAEIVALENTSLGIDAGSFLVLMGPSGSGKSTLLNMIAGIDRPTSGEIFVDGQEITALSESELAIWRNHTIGFVFQTFNLIPVLTAFENVELPLLLTRLSRAERREHVQTALEPAFQDEFVAAIHIPHSADAFPHLDGLLPRLEPVRLSDRALRRSRRQVQALPAESAVDPSPSSGDGSLVAGSRNGPRAQRT